MVFCEMTSSDGLVRKNPKTFELLEYRPDERPIGSQLCGADAAVMADAARMCVDLGFDSIDLNYGCPVRKVIAREAGAAMLNDMARLERVTSAVVNAVPLPVTAKIRIGWDKNSINAHEVARVLEGAGVKWITVHARTRTEKFTGSAHWEVIAQVKETATVPVIGAWSVRSPTTNDSSDTRYSVDGSNGSAGSKVSEETSVKRSSPGNSGTSRSTVPPPASSPTRPSGTTGRAKTT
jgi:nifR3 family TIM-barrel protein